MRTETAKQLPDGFLERGAEVTRLEAFVDAAFAFSVTLLVISLDSIPDSLPRMFEALKGVPAFAASFAMIMMFWSAHANWSRRYGLDDRTTTLLSLVLVFLVLVYVYPLKILFGAFFSWISGGWLPQVAQIRTIGDLQGMFTLYGLAFCTVSLLMAGLNRHALHAVLSPPLSAYEVAHTRGEVVRWLFNLVVAVGSIGMAMLLRADMPNWMFGLPGMFYGLLAFTHVVIERVVPETRRLSPSN